jgi:hypothetical protein
MSGVLTAVLAAFALVIPPSQPSVWWWRGIVIALTALAIGTLGRSIMLRPIPRPHRLRSLAERFICDLSKAKRTDNFGDRAAELNYEFQKEGIYNPRFPKLGNYLLDRLTLGALPSVGVLATRSEDQRISISTNV